MYPNQWMAHQDVNRQKRLWASQLSQRAPELIYRALDLCPDRHPSHPPTIGEFRRVMQELSMPTPKVIPPVQRLSYEEDDDRSAARRYTLALYAKKCTDMNFGENTYAGDFDCMAVVDMVDAATGSLSTHKEYWGALYEAFDRAWREYEDKNQET